MVKQVKRAACGFRNPANSARRIRFHCTRKTAGRNPDLQLIARSKSKSPFQTVVLECESGCDLGAANRTVLTESPARSNQLKCSSN
ncbi:hypothetical protein ACX9NE_12470 [Mycobacterium sp. ML4]